MRCVDTNLMTPAQRRIVCLGGVEEPFDWKMLAVVFKTHRALLRFSNISFSLAGEKIRQYGMANHRNI
jgi:hypothetical protein